MSETNLLMHVDVPHKLGAEEARERCRRMLAAHDFDDLDPSKSREIEVQGFPVHVRVEIHEDRVRVVLRMPRPLRLIRDAIESKVREQAREALRSE